MEFKVNWERGFIHARNEEEKNIYLEIGSTNMIFNRGLERKIELEVPPQIIDGRTLVPLRAIAEATNATIEWDAETQTVKISTQ